MGLTERFGKLKNRTIFVDSMSFIYFIEEFPRYVDAVGEIFTGAILRNEYRLLTSAVTVAEVLVHPYRMKNVELAREYEEILFNTEGFSVIPIDRTTAKEAAKLRAEFSLKTPDALQLAAARDAGADCFLTNDRALAKVTGLEIVLIDDLLGE